MASGSRSRSPERHWNAFYLLSRRATQGSLTPSKAASQQEREKPVQSDLDYFRGRAQEEIDASLSADSTAARKAHLELAHRYSELAEAIEQSCRHSAEPSFASGEHQA